MSSEQDIIQTYVQRYPVLTEEAIPTHLLQAIPLPREEKTHEQVTLETSEFNSVCPYSGLPDFARLTICYTPKDKVVEQKSLKLYLTGYRNVGILQERACQRICKDLGELLKPLSLSVTAEFAPRGGISTKVVSVYWDANWVEEDTRGS
ncbi:MAG: preQ(1) synthase [Candidatus Caldarchaeum sp.]